MLYLIGVSEGRPYFEFFENKHYVIYLTIDGGLHSARPVLVINSCFHLTRLEVLGGN